MFRYTMQIKNTNSKDNKKDVRKDIREREREMVIVRDVGGFGVWYVYRIHKRKYETIVFSDKRQRKKVWGSVSPLINPPEDQKPPLLLPEVRMLGMRIHEDFKN